MVSGCGCGDGSAPSGDCAAALQLIRSCQKWYGTPQALDTVDAQELARVLENYAELLNAHSFAFSNILQSDCQLKEAIVRCRNLHPEVGVACLNFGEEPVPPPTPPGPVPGGPVLDYPVLNEAYAGWSLRGLKDTYTGPLIRVRRSLDNTLMDIYKASNNLVDTAAMIDFAQGSDLFVETIYEQVEQIPHDLTQPTPGQQPKIYDNVTGFVVNDSGYLAMYFDGIDDVLIGPNTDLPYNTRMMAALAFQWHTQSNGTAYQLGDEQSGIQASRLQYRRPNSNSQYFQATVSGQNPGNASVTDRLNESWLWITACLEDGSPIGIRARLNGSLRASDFDGGFTSNSTGRMYLGATESLSDEAPMLLSEFIYYENFDWSQLVPEINESALTVLEDNMMASWGVTPD